MRFPEHPLPRLALRAMASLYGAAIRLRNRHYDRPGAPRRALLPVVSVGNLTVGGTGKTPLVAWLAERCARAGRKPAVVSRGYGGRAGRGPLVVSRGDGPVVNAAASGDEPYLLATTLPGVVVVVGSDRHAGTATAAELGSDLVILDDGFQHRRLHRDVDIVLLDGTDPFGNGRLLPAGPLREPRSSLARADLVLITRSAPDDDREQLEAVLRSCNPAAPRLRSAHRTVGFFAGGEHRVERPRRAFVFCGIGNPGRFRADVEAEGVEVVAFEIRRDHHRYDPGELRRWRSAAAALDAVLLTTEKDYVRLPPRGRNGTHPPLVTLRIEAAPCQPERLMAAVERAWNGSTGD